MKTTLEELRVFTTVVDTGKFTTAASQLKLTVSAISRALSRLEDKLETTLLRRTTRQFELTEEGSIFLEHARRILASVAGAEEQMALRRQEPVGLLRVNAASPFMFHTVIPLISEFRQRYPKITLELNTNDRIIDLLEQRTDIAIRIGALQDSTLHARSVGSSQKRILASPSYLAVHGTPQSVEELDQHSLLGFSQLDMLNQWPLRNSLGDQFCALPTIFASNGETLRQLALTGEGIVCLSDFMTEVDRKTGCLVQILTNETFIMRQPIHAVYYRNKQLSARILCFLDYLSEKLLTIY